MIMNAAAIDTRSKGKLYPKAAVAAPVNIGTANMVLLNGWLLL